MRQLGGKEIALDGSAGLINPLHVYKTVTNNDGSANEALSFMQRPVKDGRVLSLHQPGGDAGRDERVRNPAPGSLRPARTLGRTGRASHHDTPGEPVPGVLRLLKTRASRALHGRHTHLDQRSDQSEPGAASRKHRARRHEPRPQLWKHLRRTLLDRPVRRGTHRLVPAKKPDEPQGRGIPGAGVLAHEHAVGRDDCQRLESTESL